jgi:hypothetical protein
MNNTLHTPAPWLRSKSGNQFQIVAGSDLNGEPNELIATIHPIAHNCEYEPCDETKSNARLISAAPDLLQVVADYVLLCDLHDYVGAVPDAAREALRKAKGEA